MNKKEAVRHLFHADFLLSPTYYKMPFWIVFMSFSITAFKCITCNLILQCLFPYCSYAANQNLTGNNPIFKLKAHLVPKLLKLVLISICLRIPQRHRRKVSSLFSLMIILTPSQFDPFKNRVHSSSAWFKYGTATYYYYLPCVSARIAHPAEKAIVPH